MLGRPPTAPQVQTNDLTLPEHVHRHSFKAVVCIWDNSKILCIDTAKSDGVNKI